MDRRVYKNEWQKQYYRRPEVRERIKENTRRWNAANPFKHMIIQLRARAKIKGVPFDLDAAYVENLMPADGLCPILRVPLTFPCQGDRRRCPTDDAVSIDRCHPEKGYVRGNVAILSVKANRMKNDCTDPEAFERLAAHVRSHC